MKVFIFDFDGTLVDTMGILARKASLLINKHYGMDKEDASRAYLRTCGLPFRAQLELLFPSDPRNDSVSLEFEEWKNGIYGKRIPLRPKAEEILALLKEHDKRICISSNNLQEYVERVVVSWNVEFDLVLGWDGKGFRKGFPHFEKAKGTFGVSRDEMAFIGDSLNDLKLAGEYGIPFIAMGFTFPRVHFMKEDPGTLYCEDFGKLRRYLSRIIPELR